MFSPTLNVFGYNLLLRLAVAEGSIPFLPLEPHSVLVKPDVVGRAAGGNQCDLLRASHSGQISASSTGSDSRLARSFVLNMQCTSTQA